MPKFKLGKEKVTTKDIWLHMFKDLGNMERTDESVYDRADEGTEQSDDMTVVSFTRKGV